MKATRSGRASKTAQATTHKNSPRASRKEGDATPKGPIGLVPPDVLIGTYQNILDCILSSFSHLVSPPDGNSSLSAVIQEVKGHLYERDFKRAFSEQNYLEAYALRWSASRALCYLHIFNNVCSRLNDDSDAGENMPRDNFATAESSDITILSSQNPINRIVCFGGGAAELCAFGGVCHLKTLCSTRIEVVSPNTPSGHGPFCSVQLLDVAEWSRIVTLLHDALTSPRTLSPYASAAAKAANLPLVPPGIFESEFTRVDLLENDQIDRTQLQSYVGKSNIITFMFTLNELYTTSLNKTQRLLLDVTTSVQRGTLLLIVDSPGSYSTVSINQRQNRYPMSWLLDHTLMNLAAQISDSQNAQRSSISNDSSFIGSAGTSTPAKNQQQSAAWKKLESKDSEWFRLPAGLRYPLELEDMRYQMHLYQKI